MSSEQSGNTRSKRIVANARRSEIDERILDFAERQVCVTRHFLKFVPNRAAAYRAATRLRKSGGLQVVGYVKGASGRPETVFCNSWRPRSTQLFHELVVTEFLLCYPHFRYVRGYAVNQRIRPDAEIWINNAHIFIEVDTGQQSYRQIRQRQRAYFGVQDVLLYVTLSERRLKGLIRESGQVRAIALFTTLDRLLEDPAGEIWEDLSGQRTSIVKGGA
jgi:hypothetical protein